MPCCKWSEVLKKILSQCRIIEIGQHHNQSPTAQVQTKIGSQFTKVWRDIRSFETIKRITHNAIMGLARAKSDQRLQLVVKGRQTTQVALPFGGQTEGQCRADKSLE